MKIAIVAVLVIAVLAFTNITSYYYNSIASDIEQQLEKAAVSAKTDTAASKMSLMSATAIFRKNETFLAATLHHQEMHIIEDFLLDAKSYIENNDSSRYMAELYKLKVRMEKLRKAESFSFNDIF